MRLRRAGVAAIVVAAIAGLLWALRQGPPAPPPSPLDPTVAPRETAHGPGALPGAPPSSLPIRVTVPAPPTDDEPATFEGRVISTEGGAPVSGAELTFSRAGAASSTRAASDGAFTFQPPSAGRWLLQAVVAQGYLPFAPEWGHSPVELLARTGLHVRGIEVHLAPALELTGRVVDEDGTPVAGASVRVLGPLAEAALVPVLDRFVSDVRGEFRFSGPEGALLEARKEGYRPGRAELDWNASVNRRVTIELSVARRDQGQGGTVAGRVVQRGGDPVPGALVSAGRMRWSGEGPPVAQALSDADGSFTLLALDPGRYRVTARAEGHAPASLARVDPGARDLLLELGPGGRLRGCVRDGASGAPLAPFTVMVFDRRGPLEREIERSLSVIDPSGCYVLDDLGPGPAAVVVAAPGYGASRELSVDVPASGEAVADAFLTRGGRVIGRVVEDGDATPIAGARIRVEGALEGAASTFPVLSEGTSAADGRFEVVGLPSRASLFVAAAGHHARILGGLDVPPGGAVGPVEVRLRRTAPGEEPRVDLAGIGVVLSARGDGLWVAGLAPGGSAAEAGLRRGDVVISVDGRSVVDLGFADAINAIRGPEGTAVVLGVRREGEGLEIRAVRRMVRG